MHDVDPWTHGDDAPRASARRSAAPARAWPTCARKSVVRAIGIGVNDADVAERFVREADLDCVLLAGRYSLLEQPALDRFLPLAHARGVGVMLGGVFNSGILATGAVAGARYNYRPAPPDVARRASPHRARVRGARRRAAARRARVRARPPRRVERRAGRRRRPTRSRATSALFAQPVPAALWRDLKAERLLRDGRADAP